MNNQVQTANRDARLLGLTGRIRVRDVRYLPLVCVYCGATENLTLDHATPLARGGENHWSNLTTACLSCNSAKGRRTVAELRAREPA